jgi:intracellular septation protein A
LTPPRPNPLVEIAVTIVAPSLVLMYGTPHLGPVMALVVALAFPVAWGVREGLRRRKVNWLAVVGVFSTLLTGGIGLLQLPTAWLAVKEASVSALIGLVVAGSAWTGRPLIRALVFDTALVDTQRLDTRLAQRGTAAAFDAVLRRATLMMAGTFFFSAAANFVLTRAVVTSPAGTPAFNAELGRLTLLSYPVIALPSMLMLAAVVWWLGRELKRLSGFGFSDLLHPPAA